MAKTRIADEQDVSNSTEEKGKRDPAELKEQRDIVRQKCLSAVERATSSTILGDADVKAYYDEVLSESALEIGGFMEHQEKLQAIREMERRWIPEIIEDAAKLEREFREDIRVAKEAGGISEADAAKWIGRLTDSSIIYRKKKEFIKNTFLGWHQGWMKLGKDLTDIKKDVAKLGVNANSMPELRAINASGFLDKHFLYKRSMADEAIAALKALQQGEYGGAMHDEKLYAKARNMLQEAVDGKYLAPWKMGEWLRKIFESSENKPEQIRAFLDGKTNASLGRLMERWRAVRQGFDRVEMMREQHGTPRTFHFVHANVFLGWHYERRKSYVAEAERRFEDIQKVPYEFLQIRHELDAKGWDAAEDLIATVDRKPMSKENQEKLESMKKYLREHSGHKPKPKSVQTEQEVFEANDDLRAALDQIPHAAVKNRFIRAMQYDYDTLWALCTMYYNWEWCRKRKYSSNEKDLTFREIAEQSKYDHIRNGQPRGYAINDFTADTSVEPAARSANDTRSPQVIHVDNTTDNGTLLKYIHHNRHNRAVWYWTRITEKEISFEKIQEVIQYIQPMIKRSARKIFHAGYIPNSHGDPHKRGQNISAERLKPSLH